MMCEASFSIEIPRYFCTSCKPSPAQPVFTIPFHGLRQSYVNVLTSKVKMSNLAHKFPAIPSYTSMRMEEMHKLKVLNRLHEVE